MPSETLRAVAAESGQARDHVVTRPHRGHVSPHRFHDSGALVAEHDRPIQRPSALTVDDVKIAVAYTAGRGTDENLPSPRLVDVDRLDRERLVHFSKDRCLYFHAFPGSALLEKITLSTI